MRAFTDGLLVGLAVLATLGAGLAQAEDFSVHLDEMAKIDGDRAVPVYALEKVVKKAWVEHGVPSKTFDVFIRFKDFGEVLLDEGIEKGPIPGRPDYMGKTDYLGLYNLAEVKAGWIKDAPDIFIVAWLTEFGGTGHYAYHGYVLLRLKDGRAEVLLRGRDWITGRSDDGQIDRRLFSSDREQGQLVEQRRRWSWNTLLDDPGLPLWRPTVDQGGQPMMQINIEEVFTLRYRYGEDGLTIASCGLAYQIWEGDSLAEVARYYFGADAGVQSLLDANPDLAARIKGGEARLPKGTEVRIPLTDKQVLDRYRP